MRKRRGVESVPVKLLRANSYFVKLPWIYVNDSISVSNNGDSSPGFAATLWPQYPSPLTSGTPTSGNILYNGISYYAQFFQNMRVHASTVRCRAYCLSNDGAMRFTLTASPDYEDSQSNTSRPSQIATLPYNQVASMSGSVTRLATESTTSRAVVFLRKHQSTKKLFAVSSIRTATSNFGSGPNQVAQYGTSIFPSISSSDWTNTVTPSNRWGFTLNVYNVNSDDENFIDLDVKIESYIEFYNPIRIQEQTLQ